MDVNMTHIDKSASINCYALMWSCGEICVGSNCCGKFEKGLKMWQARLDYDLKQLDECKKFDKWIDGFKELQQKNMKSNIISYRKLIKKDRKMIKYFKNREKKQ